MAAQGGPETDDRSGKPKAKRPRRRWRRRLLWTGAVLLLLVLLAPLAVGLPFVREMIAERAGAALGRRVEIGSASAWWFRGIDVHDIVVHSPEGFDGPLARITKVHADLDVLSLVGGTLDARVRVVQPHVTLRRDAAGRSNAADLGPEEEAPPAEDEGRASLRLLVVGGTVEALDARGEAENALRDIEVAATLAPDGKQSLDLHAVAEKAGQGGGDARLALEAVRQDDGTGEFELDVPPLRLERLARLAEDTLDVGDLAGTVRVQGRGTLHPDRTLAGEFTAVVDSAGARTSAGTRLSLRRLQATSTLRRVNDETDAQINVKIGDLRVEQPRGSRTESLREPEITLEAGLRFDPDLERVRIGTGVLAAGQLASVRVEEPVRFERGDVDRLAGRLRADVDLGRLGTLRGLVPALEPLAGGTLKATLTGGGSDARDLGVGLLVEALSLRPSDALPMGYRDRRIVVALRARERDGGGMDIKVTQLDSDVVRLTSAEPGQGVDVSVAPGGAVAVDGAFDLMVRLDAASHLLAAPLGLRSGEALGGTLHLDSRGRGTAGSMRFDAAVRGRDITFPRSWSPVTSPATLDARLVATRERGTTQIRLGDLQGMGLAGRAAFTLREAGEGDGAGATPSAGELDLTVDLPTARPWLGGLMGLEPRATLAGRLRAALEMTRADTGLQVVGTTQVNQLHYQARPGAAAVREERVTLRTDVLLAADDGARSEARELVLRAAALQLDLSGSTWVGGDDPDTQLTAQLGGDAGALAPTLAALLGEGWEDLRGSGPLRGTVRVSGPPTDGGRHVTVAADLVLGSWSSGGLQATDVRVDAARGDVAAPLSANVAAGLGGGTARLDALVTLAEPARPWQADVTLTQVDLTSVVVSRGAGRYLTFVLPAIVPADTERPVLSGKLDAAVHLRAPSLDDPVRTDRLAGRGTVRMTEGAVKESSLFGGGKDGKLATLVDALRVAVPEAGTVLSEVQKSVAFSTLVSEFTVAERVVTVEQARLTGERVVVDMKGRVGFDQRVDLATRVALQGSAGKKLGEVIDGGVLPMRVRGTLAQPVVVPDLDPASLLGGGKSRSLLEEITRKLPKPPDLPDLPEPKLPKLPKPKLPKLPKLPNPFD